MAAVLVLQAGVMLAALGAMLCGLAIAVRWLGDRRDLSRHAIEEAVCLALLTGQGREGLAGGPTPQRVAVATARALARIKLLAAGPAVEDSARRALGLGLEDGIAILLASPVSTDRLDGVACLATLAGTSGRLLTCARLDPSYTVRAAALLALAARGDAPRPNEWASWMGLAGPMAHPALFACSHRPCWLQAAS